MLSSYTRVFTVTTFKMMIIKSQFSARSEFYFACLEAQVNGWNLQISDKRTTHLSENTKDGIESGRYGGL